MEEKFNLIKKEATHSFTKRKEDFDYFSLTTGSAENLDNPTGTFSIEINSTDAYLDLSETCVVAKIKINIAADKNIALENNLFPNMFRQIILMRSGNTFQTIDEPGEMDSVYKFLMYNKNHKQTLGCFDGWYLDTHSGSFVRDLTVNDHANPTAD